MVKTTSLQLLNLLASLNLLDDKHPPAAHSCSCSVITVLVLVIECAWLALPGFDITTERDEYFVPGFDITAERDEYFSLVRD